MIDPTLAFIHYMVEYRDSDTSEIVCARLLFIETALQLYKPVSVEAIACHKAIAYARRMAGIRFPNSNIDPIMRELILFDGMDDGEDTKLMELYKFLDDAQVYEWEGEAGGIYVKSTDLPQRKTDYMDGLTYIAQGETMVIRQSGRFDLKAV